MNVKFIEVSENKLPESWEPEFRHSHEANPDKSWEPDFAKTEEFQAMDFDDQIEKVREEATKLGVDGKIKAKGEKTYISVFEPCPVIS